MTFLILESYKTSHKSSGNSQIRNVLSNMVKLPRQTFQESVMIFIYTEWSLAFEEFVTDCIHCTEEDLRAPLRGCQIAFHLLKPDSPNVNCGDFIYSFLQVLSESFKRMSTYPTLKHYS